MAEGQVFGRVVFVKPIGGLRLHGAGERTARAPAPGALPREEPLLPRMETILGALASLYWAQNSGGNRCSTWETCVLEPAIRLICGGKPDRVRVYGPFLVVQDTSDPKVFVNVSAGLLEASREALEKYWGAAKNVTDLVSLPRIAMQKQESVSSALGELIGSGSFVPREKLLKRLVGLALEPGRKTASYGLLYSQAWIDVRAAGPHAAGVYVALLAECTGDMQAAEGVREITVGTLGPRSVPASVIVANTRTLSRGEADGQAYIVTSNQPLDTSLLGMIRAIHPLRPPSHLELHTSAYASQVELYPPRKTQPQPALWPGTVVLENKNYDLLEIINSLKIINSYSIDDNHEVLLYRTASIESLGEVAEVLRSLAGLAE